MRRFGGGGQQPPGDERIAGDQHEGEPIDAGKGRQAGQQKIIDLRVSQQIPRNLGEAGR